MKKFPFRLERLDPFLVEETVRRALEEDLGEKGDITTRATLGSDPVMKKAFIVAKEEGMVCGMELVKQTFFLVDPSVRVEVRISDGLWVQRGEILAELCGAAQSLLVGERVALNFLGLLSGISTKTARLVAQLKGTGLKLLDTRKTLPGLRMFEKYAVAIGGGYNHRYGLYDMILIKENHRAAAGGITVAVERARRLYPEMVIEVEVSTLEDVREALATSADILMLDNMKNEDISQAVALVKGQKKLEVSGNMTEERIIALARIGVDYVSMGALTHTVRPLDVSLLMEDFVS
ncbi:MAG: carboxylating nicotinate-nucleotide diphosphorylase [Brevinematales bacterium]|nr:carboxylating nicotinate-nucleotide diphosphorylase [Brevinematales bacterium]